MYWLKRNSTNLSSYWIAGCTCDFTLNSLPFNSTEVAWRIFQVWRIFQYFVMICNESFVRLELPTLDICCCIQVKQADELENILAKKFLRFLSMRAESFQVLRRKPVQVGSHVLYHVSIPFDWSLCKRNYAIIPSSAVRILTWCLPGYGCALW